MTTYLPVVVFGCHLPRGDFDGLLLAYAIMMDVGVVMIEGWFSKFRRRWYATTRTSDGSLKRERLHIGSHVDLIDGMLNFQCRLYDLSCNTIDHIE